MNTKDWILLIIPIMTNGLLLFVFQFALKRYFDQKDAKKFERRSQINELTEYLTKVHTALYKFIQRKESDDFESQFNNYSHEISNLKRYVDSVSGVLKDYDVELDNLFSTAQLINDRLGVVMSIQSGAMNDSDREYLVPKFLELYDKLSKLISKCKCECL